MRFRAAKKQSQFKAKQSQFYTPGITKRVEKREKSIGLLNDWPEEVENAKIGRNTSFSYAFDCFCR
ncbi:MAG: hypothetical protein WBC05_12925 [Sedimentisphaerales bacterium]